MSTSYIGSKTAAENGADFILATGASKTFFTIPALGANESLRLEIKDAAGDSNYVTVGDLAYNGQSVGVVTARGAGNSKFRVVKSLTSVATEVFFD
tara:strand:- start:93 stop:380 length:288 start_codon:yes stop_codon:yes gene_type:complete